LNTVLKYFPWGLAIIFLSCAREPIPESVRIGKTVKISSTLRSESGETGTYYWQFSDSPDSSYALLWVENDKVLFTPDRQGSYILSCSMISSENQIIAQEKFHFWATEPAGKPANAEDMSVIQSRPEAPDDSTKKIEKVDDQDHQALPDDQVIHPTISPSGTGRFAIQISSWKTRKSADMQIEKLAALGIVAHIELTYLPEPDRIWYRIRIGDFSSLKEAKRYSGLVSQKLGKTPWIDDVQKGN